MRRAFARWGLPRRIRVDNGAPWGSAGDLPTDLALWLVGLGVEMIWNPPRCPQANGVVERSQGTGKRWAEPATCADASELQRRIDRLDRIQRERYPSIRGRPRLEAYPDLEHSGCPYDPGLEPTRWELERVLGHLAEYVAVRRADAGGTISLYNRSRYVGRALGGRDVHVSLDPTTAEWVYADRQGVEYRRQPAEELTADRIAALEVSRHRDRPDKARRKGVAPLPANPHGA
jgi:transposase InsO family protein